MSTTELLEFRELLSTVWITRAIHAATVLGIADAVAGGHHDAKHIAATVDADEVSIDRLLRALTTLGLLERVDEGGYALTAMGVLLRSDVPDSQRGRVLLQCGAASMRSWGAFDDCIRTGKTAAHLLDGIDDPFAAFDADPSARAQFDNAMAEGAHQVARQIADAYDFTDITRIVDVGGGYGTLLPPILHSRPGMTGIVVDRPNCREGAERTIAETGLHDRYSFVGADFFVDALPPGADAYVLKSVLHDFDVERSIAILRRCREAMTDSSRLLVVEIVVPDRLERTARHRGIVAADLHMLVATGGRERTESQYRALLAAAGLRLETVTPTGTAPGFDVIDARPT